MHYDIVLFVRTGVVVANPNTPIPDVATQLNHTDVIPIQESIMHPEYHRNRRDEYNDIGLIRLTRELSLTGKLLISMLPQLCYQLAIIYVLLIFKKKFVFEISSDQCYK